MMEFVIIDENGNEVLIEESKSEYAALLFGKSILASQIQKPSDKVTVVNPAGQEKKYLIVYAVEIYTDEDEVQ